MKPAFLALIGLTVASCAPSADLSANVGADTRSGPRQCFDTDRVRNFRQADRPGDIYVRSGNRDRSVFLLSAAGGCWDLDSAVQIGLRAHGFAGTRACEGDPVQIFTPDGPGSRSDACRAHVVRVLSEADVAALPERDRP